MKLDGEEHRHVCVIGVSSLLHGMVLGWHEQAGDNVEVYIVEREMPFHSRSCFSEKRVREESDDGSLTSPYPVDLWRFTCQLVAEGVQIS